MKHAKIVIGLNYGDEGKGLMTDFFCRQFPATDLVLNVRYNGGAQAGHTVVTEDGRRHVFSHFGAGSFSPNVITVFDKQFIINPILYVSERKKLEELGIGRPSTYAPTISTIILRGYVVKDSRPGQERSFRELSVEKGNIVAKTLTEIWGAEKNKLIHTIVL